MFGEPLLLFPLLVFWKLELLVVLFELGDRLLAVLFWKVLLLLLVPVYDTLLFELLGERLLDVVVALADEPRCCSECS